MPYEFSQDQIKSYREQGFVLMPSLFDSDDIERVDQAIDEVVRQAFAAGNYEAVLELEPRSTKEKPVLRRLKSPFDLHEAFRNLATDDRLLDRVQSLIGPSIQLQHSKLNMKPAGVGSPVEWHQDLSYFPHTNPDLVTVLVYLDEATKENGCLQVIPRHHHHFLECHTHDGAFAGMITEDVSRYGEPVPLQGLAGSAIFMHCMTPHASLANQSSKHRRTLIFEYRAGDSYPIYFSPRVAQEARVARQIRGKPSRYARLAGPPPLIPAASDAVTSLYDLQTASKKKLTENRKLQ